MTNRTPVSSIRPLSKAPRSWEDDFLSGVKNLFDEKVLTDVSFVFDQDRGVTSSVDAHKFVLMAVSKVFRAMFTGSIPEGSKVQMNDPEIDMESFKVFIEYLYTGKLTINIENSSKLVYLAHKYDVKSLEEKCSEFLLKNVTSSNVHNVVQIVSKFIIITQISRLDFSSKNLKTRQCREEIRCDIIHHLTRIITQSLPNHRKFCLIFRH